MQSYIKEYLTKDIPIKITPDLATQLIRMVVAFEIRDEHPLTLNSQMFGVHKFSFSSRDRQMFFDIIGYMESDVARVINNIPTINKKFKVVSDPFNVAIVYVAHLIIVSNISANLKHDATISILNYLQYKFIGSAVNWYFKYGTKYEIMQTVVESLSMKFDVRKSGSWKNVVVERSESISYDTKAHYTTLEKFDNDKYILYLITDTSTRIRSQLQIIATAYYEIRETNNYMLSHSSTTTLDGEKVLRERDGSFEMISSSVFHKTLFKSSFVDDRYVKMVQASVPRLNAGIIRRLLSAISDEARHQSETNDTMKIVKRRDGTEIYNGIETLIDHVIHVIYTTAIRNDKININSKIAVYTSTRNIFSAARTANQELINVRSSLEDIIKRTRISTRESTISGLSVCFALYVCLLSFGVL